MKEIKFTPKQWVLARDNKDERWFLAQYSNYEEESRYPYTMCGGAAYRYCIPEEGNEHLLGTTDDYDELNDGDFIFITTNTNKYYAIFKKVSSYHNILVYTYSKDGKTWFRADENPLCSLAEADISLLSEKDKQVCLESLHNNNADWDAEKKEIVEYKWKPEEGDDYYYIMVDGSIGHTIWGEYRVDKDCYDFGNCFRTHEEASEMADKFKELLKTNSMEDLNDFIEDVEESEDANDNFNYD